MDLNALEIQRAAVSIQREQHEQSGNPMEFIKALLMWVETPEEYLGIVADTQPISKSSIGADCRPSAAVSTTLSNPTQT